MIALSSASLLSGISIFQLVSWRSFLRPCHRAAMCQMVVVEARKKGTFVGGSAAAGEKGRRVMVIVVDVFTSPRVILTVSEFTVRCGGAKRMAMGEVWRKFFAKDEMRLGLDVWWGNLDTPPFRDP
jgi:hypothetical protein